MNGATSSAPAPSSPMKSDRFPKRFVTDPKNAGYKEQYGIIVLCRDENHQREVYDELRARGHQLKVVVT